MQHCPDLLQLSFTELHDWGKEIWRIAETVADMKWLQLLSWPDGPKEFRETLKEVKKKKKGLIFPSLTRLILALSDDPLKPVSLVIYFSQTLADSRSLRRYQLLKFSNLPNLEHLYYKLRPYWINEGHLPVVDIPTRPFQSLIPSTARRLRASCHFRRLADHPWPSTANSDAFPYDIRALDTVAEEDIIGVFSSFLIGPSDLELLHIRLLAHIYEICDIPLNTEPREGLEKWTDRRKYVSANGVDMCKYFALVDGKGGMTWSCFTDYRGRVVPREIFDKLVEVENLCSEDWVGKRGIKLGSAAGAVLEAWMTDAGAGERES